MQAPIDTSTISGWVTSFLMTMVGLSVAAERVTETVKQYFGGVLNSVSKSIYAAIIQTIAILSGILVTAISGLNPLKVDPSNHWVNWVVTGLLVSGGSAFWNNLLGILQAAKVQKQGAPQTSTITSP